MLNQERIDKLNTLKKEQDAVILAHYYVNDEVKDIADYIGDSYYLSKLATTLPHKTICVAGVSFMGESAKILNPEKTVLLPEPNADCPMAHMADIQAIKKVKQEYKDVAVVCYINSTAEIKQYADVCVTSSNALKIVRSLPNSTIYFIPDENLGRYVASKVPEKHFIFHNGFCHVHAAISANEVRSALLENPNLKVLAHPECTKDVLELVTYIGSTSGILEYANKSKDDEFLILTERGILYELRNQNPNKHFYTPNLEPICPNMKKITVDKIIDCLSNMSTCVELDEDTILKAGASLNNMLALANQEAE